MKKKIGYILFAIVILACLVHIYKQKQVLNRIVNEQSIKAEQLEEKISENKRLLEEVKKINSDEYIEKQARERFNMIKEGEIPVSNTRNTSAQ